MTTTHTCPRCAMEIECYMGPPRTGIEAAALERDERLRRLSASLRQPDPPDRFQQRAERVFFDPASGAATQTYRYQYTPEFITQAIVPPTPPFTTLASEGVQASGCPCAECVELQRELRNA